jgi:hypothetical protein
MRDKLVISFNNIFIQQIDTTYVFIIFPVSNIFDRTVHKFHDYIEIICFRLKLKLFFRLFFPQLDYDCLVVPNTLIDLLLKVSTCWSQ